MLKFQEQNEPIAADQVRVRPHELVEALRVVEERKEAEARAQEETIPLGQAMEALGVHYTPEEVLEALQAHRVGRSQVRPRHTKQTSGKRAMAGLAVISLISLSMVASLSWRIAHPAPIAATPAVAVAPEPVSNASIGMQTKRLSEISVGQTFQCDTNTLLRVANGSAGQETVVAVDTLKSDLWAATRTPTGIEVQGVMAAGDALKFANGQEATLYRSTENFSWSITPTTVQVPLARLTRVTSGPDDSYWINIKAVSESQ